MKRLLIILALAALTGAAGCSGAVNTTIVEQAPASPEVPQGRPD